MAFDLRSRSFLSLRDFLDRQIRLLLKRAADLKAANNVGTERRTLTGGEIALICEKALTRTRVGFEVAAHDQGAHVTYPGPSDTYIGKKESIKDTVRVLGQMYDAIEDRGFGQTVVGAQVQKLFDPDAMESAASVMLDQAENRMHTIKAELAATLGL